MDQGSLHLDTSIDLSWALNEPIDLVFWS